MNTTTTTITLAALERRALAAHRTNEPWSTFWPTIRPAVVQLAGADRRRFHRIYATLLTTTVAGDLDGQEPPGSAPWERDA